MDVQSTKIQIFPEKELVTTLHAYHDHCLLFYYHHAMGVAHGCCYKVFDL
ncbi:MAG: hypothetical protein LIO93_01770 [Bacteroidales bacterium]|nr:hypothetical protein [Bacteroidales bacterium]